MDTTESVDQRVADQAVGRTFGRWGCDQSIASLTGDKVQKRQSVRRRFSLAELINIFDVLPAPRTGRGWRESNHPSEQPRRAFRYKHLHDAAPKGGGVAIISDARSQKPALRFAPGLASR